MNAERRPTNAPDVFSWIGIVLFCSALVGTILPGVVAWRADVFSQNLEMAGAVAFFSASNPLMWLWTVVYASFGTLCVLLCDRYKRKRLARPIDGAHKTLRIVGIFILAFLTCLLCPQAIWEILLAALALSVLAFFHGLHARMLPVAAIGFFYLLPAWIRNYGDEGSWVRWYASAHISLWSFQTADLNAIFVFVLLALIWDLSFASTQAEMNRAPHHANIAERVRIESQHFSNTFLRWLITSVLLACGFIAFSSTFWNLAVQAHAGESYIFQAAGIHVGWGLSWIVVSLPLFTAWRKWDETHRALFISNDPQAKSLREDLQTFFPFERLKAFGGSAAALAASLFAFLTPVLQLPEVQQHFPAWIQALVGAHAASSNQ